jgi:endonuclease/exonuclease/phosphatase family metal-dependent hydrolase
MLLMAELTKDTEPKRRNISRIIKSVAACTLILTSAFIQMRDTPEPDAEFLQDKSNNELLEDSVTIMTANVHRWKLHGRGNYPRFIKAVQKRDPDIICMQEVLADKGQLRDLHKLGYNIYFFASTHELIDGRYGNAVASKSELLDTSAMLLPSRHNDSHRNAINFSIQSSRGTLEFLSTHLDTNITYSDRQIVYINSTVGDTMDFGCGDFNQSLDELESSPLGSMAKSRRFSTFPSIKPRLQLDHIITNCGRLTSGAMLDDFGSDHLSVTKTFDIKNCSETR